MRTEDLVFWLDILRESTSPAGGVLCQRHGDSMVVPRGWTLDDLRDPELHLFRPPSRAERVGRRARRRTGSSAASDDSQQLELGGLLPREPIEPEPELEPAVPTATETSVAATDRHTTTDGSDGAVSDPAEQWTPSFDDADDLDGLLSARSPLLSRAFRGAGRPGRPG